MRYLLDAARSKRLDQMAVGYAVAAWAIVQGASMGAAAFEWAPWILQFAIVAAVGGLPVVLIGAWARGVRAETGNALKPSRADLHVLILLALFLFAAGVPLVWFFWPRQVQHETIATNQANAPPNSLAVLPFANLSGDPTKQYFGDGIADELIGKLSRIPSLRVAARASSFAIQARHADARTIARSLNVRTILDGSIRESANHIRIEAELIDAQNGFSIWSQTYDRDLGDILVLEDDIADQVTRGLRARLFGEPHPHDGHGIDPNAYRSYLQAKSLMRRGNVEDLDRAVDLLKRVTALEPDYANGHAALGSAYSTLADRYAKTDLVPNAEASSRQAIKLDPKNLEGLSILTQALLDKWRWNEAIDLFRQARAVNPNSSAVLHLQSALAYVFHYPEADLAAEVKAAQLDPLAAGLKYNIALWYWNEARYDEAALAIQEVLKLRKGKASDIDEECAIEVWRGHLAAAVQLEAQITSYYAENAQNLMNCPFYLAVAQRNVTRARQILKAAGDDMLTNGGFYTNVGEGYRQLGDLANAMIWFERAYTARDSLLFLEPYWKWLSPALLRDSRWKALWARKPIQDWEAARISFGAISGLQAR